ncbi:MAG TPA: RraA family protein [Jiangellaceae bacterium]|nr:RraA family protein [Jiangellaceae bacterium]
MNGPSPAVGRREQPAGGHCSATLFEAAASEWRRRAGRIAMPEVAVDHTIRASWIGAAVAGPAYTVRGSGGDNLALHRAVVAAPPSHVLAADVEGAAYGHWGEVLAVAAQQRGILGLVIDGGVRDRDKLRALDFPVFSGHDSIRGTRKDVVGELGVPIRLGGVPVRTGDLVVGDTDGVVVVPSERVPAVLEEADRRAAHEHDIIAALHDGRTTLDLYGLG